MDGRFCGRIGKGLGVPRLCGLWGGDGAEPPEGGTPSAAVTPGALRQIWPENSIGPGRETGYEIRRCPVENPELSPGFWSWAQRLGFSAVALD